MADVVHASALLDATAHNPSVAPMLIHGSDITVDIRPNSRHSQLLVGFSSASLHPHNGHEDGKVRTRALSGINAGGSCRSAMVMSGLPVRRRVERRL